MTAPVPPRYEVRPRDIIPERPSFGLYDTFEQCWVEFQEFATKGAAVSACAAHNRAYAGETR